MAVALRTARVVEQAAAEWNAAARPEHYLWDDKRLTTTLTTLGMTGNGGNPHPTTQPIVELDDEVREFLKATSQRVHAIQQRERRRRTRTITVLSTLLVFVVLALIATGVAVFQQQRASAAQNTAIARAMVAEAERIRDRDPRAALQLGAAANQFDPSARNQASLNQSLASTSGFVTTLRGHTGSVRRVAFAPDGRTLATASHDRTVRLWDVSDRNRPRELGQPLTVHTSRITDFAVSSDELTLATTSADKTAILWDLTDSNKLRQLSQPLTGHPTELYGLAFASDGRTLVTVGFDLRLWDLTDRDQPRQLGQPLQAGHSTAGIVTMAFAPDGRTMATVGLDRTVVLWDMPSFDRFAGNAVQESCIRAGGPLGQATWDQYAPSADYQDTCAGS